MTKIKRPVSINGVEFDALIGDSRVLPNTVPAYPVESGFSISDTIIHNPEMLSLTLFVTDSAVDWKSRGHGGAGWTSKVIKQLEDLYFSSNSVTVKTPDAEYANMAIVDISIAPSEHSGYDKQIDINLQKIETVDTKKTTIPDSYGKGGKTGTNAGTASISTSATPPSKSGAGNSSGQQKGSIPYNTSKDGGLLQ